MQTGTIGCSGKMLCVLYKRVVDDGGCNNFNESI